ncbi:MAG TPA: response regulator transcription factor, partial [Candidatus Hydrogenedentes bacterium]|nr:response regulator transcription factor [Candidatus Hydrogenedentota bacterium]
MTMARSSPGDVLIVEPDAELAREIRSYLEGSGYATEWVNTGEKAFNRLDSQPFDVVVAELSVSRVDGMRVMS